jgi:TPR repeat protein
MSDTNNLPAPGGARPLSTVSGSSLLNRGLANIRRTDETSEAEKIFRHALSLCSDADFVQMSDICDGQDRTRTNWVNHPSLEFFAQAANMEHGEAKFCLGAIHARQKPLEAIWWYRKASDQGHPEASYQYVKYLYLDSPEKRSSFAQPISWEKACELLEIAAHAKHLSATRELAHLLRMEAEQCNSSDRESLYIRAAHWYRQAALAGDSDAAFGLAEILCLGDGVSKDLPNAVIWYHFAVERGHRKAMVELGYLYERGQGVLQDTPQAISLYRRAGELALQAGDRTEAQEHFQLSAGLGDGDSCFQLGQMLAGNAENDRQTREAIAWLIKAAEQGNAEAAYAASVCFASLGDDDCSVWRRKAGELGHLLAQKELGDEYRDMDDHPESLRWYRSAAEQGDAESAYRLGSKLRWGGDGITVDEQEAAKWIIFAADKGYADAYFSAAWILHSGFGVERSDEKSVTLYRLACKAREYMAFNNLGYMYQHGFGVRKNPEKAFANYEKAAQSGITLAKCNLAFCYKNGTGVDIDYDEALALMLEAAEVFNYPAAQSYLGNWYKTGQVVAKDHAKARYWLAKAADQGDAGAANNLGVMCEDGEDSVADLTEAAKYYRVAAEGGDPFGQCNLGIMYENGRGVQQDLEEAIRWYRLSARQMHQSAIDALKRLGADVRGPATPSQSVSAKANVEDRVRKALAKVLADALADTPKSISSKE